VEIELYRYIYTLLICSCITSLVLYLSPDDPKKDILEIGCSCVMFLAFVSPLFSFDYENYTSSFSKFVSQLDNVYFLQEDFTVNATKEIIEDQYGEYILNEAVLHNIDLSSVSVITIHDSEGNWIPYKVVYNSTKEIPHNFKTHISICLGVPEERQTTDEHE